MTAAKAGQRAQGAEEQAPAEASYADADPFNAGEAANRKASMAAQKTAGQAAAAAEDHTARDKAEQASPPSTYIADKALFLGDPAAAGTAPVRAFNPGDEVLPADVWRHGWRDQVHPPDGYVPAATAPKEE